MYELLATECNEDLALLYWNYAKKSTKSILFVLDCTLGRYLL